MGLKTKRPQGLTAWQWCRLAASNDEARPVITGIYYSGSANGSMLAATDGHRLHSAPHEPFLQLPQGVYAADELAGIDGKYPNYEQVMKPADEVRAKGWVVGRWDLLLRSLRGATAFWKATKGWQGATVQVPVNNHPGVFAHVHPTYLLDALRGMGEGAYLLAPGPLEPLQLCDEAGRRAAIMPIRVALDGEEQLPELADSEALLVVQNFMGVPFNTPSLRLPLTSFLFAEKEAAE